MCICVRTHLNVQPSFKTATAVASKAAVSHLTLSPSSFPRLLFPASVTSQVFFSPLPLFPTQSLSHLYLSLLYLPASKILLQREVMVFFLFYIHLPFLESSLF